MIISLCFATNNDNKIREAKSILGRSFHLLSLNDIGCADELPETTGTIAGNSAQKATYVFEKFGVDCFADDSGLEVRSLHNAPGVDSAYYAGPDRNPQNNIGLLLKNLEGISDRSARFITVITLIISGKVFQFEGALEGMILEQPKGTLGFGYDPVFLPIGFEKTLAEMTLEAKNQISHRGRALKQLAQFLSSSNSGIQI